LVAAKPEAKALFDALDIDHPEGPKFSAHCLRFFNGFDMMINLLKDPEAFEAALENFAAKHGKIEGIKREHFQV